MAEESLSASPVIRLATPEDIDTIDALDRLSTSPTRDIHREMEKYFGSVDPSTHERTLIFLAEVNGVVAGKAELMLPPPDVGAGVEWSGEGAFVVARTGYVKRVIVHPNFRKLGIARKLMEHIITLAHSEFHLTRLDLHVWENNLPAIRLYESLGFKVQHRELYFRLVLG